MTHVGQSVRSARASGYCENLIVAQIRNVWKEGIGSAVLADMQAVPGNDPSPGPAFRRPVTWFVGRRRSSSSVERCGPNRKRPLGKHARGCGTADSVGDDPTRCRTVGLGKRCGSVSDGDQTARQRTGECRSTGVPWQGTDRGRCSVMTEECKVRGQSQK